jgi:hypothetical protein
MEYDGIVSGDLLCLLDLDWNWLLILDDDLGLGGSNTD